VIFNANATDTFHDNSQTVTIKADNAASKQYWSRHARRQYEFPETFWPSRGPSGLQKTVSIDYL
jgi:hypothetical protein